MDIEMVENEPSTASGFNYLTKTFGAPPLSHSTGLLQTRTHYHHHHDSISSTSATSSSNPSPTTTVSTASTGDRSPSTSPDSPKSVLPLSAFGSVHKSPKLSAESLHKLSASQNPSFRSLSPIKKASRNSKNLSLNMFNSMRAASVQPLVSPIDNSNKPLSAPSSPGFIPPPMPRRRPSNLGLTIKLPSTLTDKSSSMRVTTLQSRPSLRHHVSSPSLFTPVNGTINRQSKLSSSPPQNATDSLSSSMSSSHLSSSPSESSGPIIEMDEEDMLMMENDGEGPKSPAYPEGPVCIYEPNIFLFSEPNAELARNFDLIVNVAREVKNPFDVEEERIKKERESLISPLTATSVESFATALETPAPEKRPEYIHIPWDHNTAILPDLPKLVETLKQKTEEGKKILVHCQCGVSRSASLIVAYGLFMNPQQTVQEAYDFVKERSRWIGPNMSLIYQLSDWKAKVGAQNGRAQRGKPSARGGTAQNTETRPKLGHHSRSTNSSDPTPFVREKMDEPMTAPLPHLRQLSQEISMSQSQPRDISKVRTRHDNGDIIMGIQPGPMSAPPGMINIPGSRLSHDPREQHFAPPPPSAGYPYEETDQVGEMVTTSAAASRQEDYGGMPPPTPGFGPTGGFMSMQADRVDDYDGMPPPTPSFAPNGSFRFEKPLLKSRKKRSPLVMENLDEPPPTPSIAAPKGSFFNAPLPSLSSSSSHTSQQQNLQQPTFKKPEIPIRPSSTSNSIQQPPHTHELGSSFRKSEALPSRPNPDFHRRFPSILSSFDEPPPSPSPFVSHFTSHAPPPAAPMRMPSISNKKKDVPTPSQSDDITMEDLKSPENELPSFFSDPRSPNTGMEAMPTTRSIFDVL